VAHRDDPLGPETLCSEDATEPDRPVADDDGGIPRFDNR
jgi:hypothetical protein